MSPSFDYVLSSLSLDDDYHLGCPSTYTSDACFFDCIEDLDYIQHVYLESSLTSGRRHLVCDCSKFEISRIREDSSRRFASGSSELFSEVRMQRFPREPETHIQITWISQDPMFASEGETAICETVHAVVSGDVLGVSPIYYMYWWYLILAFFVVAFCSCCLCGSLFGMIAKCCGARRKEQGVVLGESFRRDGMGQQEPDIYPTASVEMTRPGLEASDIPVAQAVEISDDRAHQNNRQVTIV